MAEDVFFDSSRIFSKYVTVESLSYARDEFLVRDDDVILVSYPRSGSHWMAHILSLITSEGDPSWVQNVHFFVRCPWIEVEAGQKLLVDHDGPRLMATHLSVPFFPKSYFTSCAKIILNIRDPRDVATSSYHLFKLLSQNEDLRTLGDYLPIFLQGDAVYGSWFDHILGWMEKRRPGSFLIVSYEELQRDLRSSVQKICQFLGKNLDSEKIDLVVQNSSFTAMKNNRLSSSYQTKCSVNHTDINIPLLRKGISGDWKNHFTVAQSEAFDKVYQEKMSSVDAALFPWS